MVITALVFFGGLLSALLMLAVVLATQGVYEPIIGFGIASVVTPLLFFGIMRVIDG